jgi:SAM-dependent methyltransferase
MSPPTRFLSERPPDVHSARPWAPFGYVNRRLDGLVGDLIAASGVGPGTCVVDYGCAQRPYRRLLPEGVQYVGADLPGNPLADVVLDADGRVPLPDASADAVLSTQVLEHVADPTVYLSECRRLLKPGGSLLLSTHGIMYYHRDPEDYWRWTSVGLAAVVEQSGLRVEQQFGVLGLAAAAIQLWQDATIGHVPRPLRPLFALCCQLAIRRSDRGQTPQGRIDNGLVIAVRAVRADTAETADRTGT